MYFKTPVLLICLVSISCINASSHENVQKPGKDPIVQNNPVNPFGHIADIPLPEGFVREKVENSTFTAWLRKVELKKDRTVYLYNGLPKGNQSAQFAVLNISVGNKDLQQCADAVMRLRAEYLFSEKMYDKIIFFDNDHTAYPFTPPYNRINFNNYLDRVFGMCGSASLSRQLRPVNDFSSIRAGNVLIRGGFPGHAVMVMDMAKNPEGKKIYLLAQSYMPAQDIHVLVNPINPKLSPWYEENDDEMIRTPEYWFYPKELKQW